MFPRGFLWFSGVIIFLLLMATAFMGYVLPWGQMSFWDGFSVDNATLNRFFSLHYLLPFLIAGLAVVHLSLLHTTGSGNPLGINTNIDSITFYPYFYSKDVFAFLTYVFFLLLIPIIGLLDSFLMRNSMNVYTTNLSEP